MTCDASPHMVQAPWSALPVSVGGCLLAWAAYSFFGAALGEVFAAIRAALSSSPSEATSLPMSVENAFAIGVSRAARALARTLVDLRMADVSADALPDGSAAADGPAGDRIGHVHAVLAHATGERQPGGRRTRAQRGCSKCPQAPGETAHRRR